MTTAKHTESPINGEYSLCGRAYDDDESDDRDGPPVFAKVGERITCAECLTIIRFCKSIVGNIQPKD